MKIPPVYRYADAGIVRFIDDHRKLRKKIEEASKAGKCSVIPEIAKDISEEELAWHLKFFEMHNYSIAPLPDVICNRDALQELVERLSTSKK